MATIGCHVQRCADVGIACPGDMTIEVDLSGLEAPWRQAEVSSHSARSLEACWVINAGLEGQRSDGADARRRHQPLRICAERSDTSSPA